MSTSLSKMARELQSIMSESDSRKTKPFDSEAEVVKVEGDYVYVHFAGGVDETPVRKTMDANVGDKVQVRVSSGKAWLIGNATAPPTDDKTANKALGQATTAFKSVKQLEDVVDQVTDEIDDISEDLGDLGDYAEELNEALTSTNNHFWVDDNSGAVYVSMADGDATRGYAMRHAASGIVLLHDNDVLTSWTGTGQAYYSEGERVALYSSEGALIGSENGSQINISSNQFSVIGEDGVEQFNIGDSETTNTELLTIKKTFGKKTSSGTTKTYFTLPLDIEISYTGRSSGAFTLDGTSSGIIFSGTYADKAYSLRVSSIATDNASVVFYNATTSDMTFTFSYRMEYDVPLITSIGSMELGGGISASGSGTIGGDLAVTGEVTSSNIGAHNYTGGASDTIPNSSTWQTLNTSVTLGAGVYIIAAYVSFDETGDTYATGYRTARIYNPSSDAGYGSSTMQVPAVPKLSGVSNVNTYLNGTTMVWASADQTYVVQARQTSGKSMSVSSGIRWVRIK